MPSPLTKRISDVFHFVAGAMILFWVLESCINSHKPSWHYVDANSSPDGLQGWIPGPEHIARGMSIHVYADTAQDPSPIHATFTPAVGRAHARIRILALEAATSRQGDLNLPPFEPAELFIDPVNTHSVTWTHPTPIATDLHTAKPDAETLHFTIHFEITRSDRTTQHTITHNYIPRRY